MYDSDPMLNGKIMRERHQELIQRVQRENLACDLKNTQGNHKSVIPLRAVLVAVINLVIKML